MRVTIEHTQRRVSIAAEWADRSDDVDDITCCELGDDEGTESYAAEQSRYLRQMEHG